MYVKANDSRQPALGVDPIACDSGEEWDWTSMACVTAGQATTPTPQLPPATVPPFTTPPVMAPPAPPPEPTFYEKYKTPILVVGAVAAALVVGYMITPNESSAATPNKKPSTSIKAGQKRKTKRS